MTTCTSRYTLWTVEERAALPRLVAKALRRLDRKESRKAARAAAREAAK